MSDDPPASARTRPLPAILLAVGVAVLLLAAGYWWRFGGEHLSGDGGEISVGLQVGEPVHLGVAIATEGGGEVTIEEARVRNVKPQDIATAEVGSVQNGEALDLVIGADVAPLSFGPVRDVVVDGNDQYLVVSFLSDEPGVYTLDDVVVRYRDSFRSRGSVADLCAVVTVTTADPDTPADDLSEDDAAIVREAGLTDC
ncbi:MAG: hypothetical protein ACERLM_11940 [Acidimicrobiales bacterium]